MDAVKEELKTVVSDGPPSSAHPPTAGAIGSEWFDLTAPGEVMSHAWDQTISNTDSFHTGKIIFAVPASPAFQPDPELAPTMAAHLISAFRQMMFDSIIYEIITSKGSLTNAKFALAFIPGFTVKQIKEMSMSQVKSVVDRQSNKIIFSPDPDNSQTLLAHWAFPTSIADTAANMGTVVMVLYHQVVANISDGGTNEIRITCRMGVKGLKARYPIPPGTNQSDDQGYIINDIQLFEPMNPSIESTRNDDSIIDRPSIGTTIQYASNMVALPSTFFSSIAPTDLKGCITKNGKIAQSIQGFDNVFAMHDRKFALGCSTQAGEIEEVGKYLNQCKISEFNVYFITEGSAPTEVTECTIRLRFPWEMPDGAELLATNVESSTGICITDVDACESLVGHRKLSNKPYATYDDKTKTMGYDAIFVFAGKQGEKLRTQFHFTGSIPKRYVLNIADFHIHLDIGNPEQIASEVPTGKYAVTWAQYPSTADSTQVVREIEHGLGPPLTLNLNNQHGASEQERNPEELSAQMVVGGGVTRGAFAETLGDILHTVASHVPILDLFVKNRGENAVVVPAQPTSPIHYVPLGTEKRIPSARFARTIRVSGENLRLAHARRGKPSLVPYKGYYL